MKHIGFKLVFTFIYILALLPAASAAPFDVELFSKPFSNFKLGSDQKTFGKLEFVGGIEFTSSNTHVGALSGMVLINERSQILAVTDTGYWFAASIKRNSKIGRAHV